MNNYRDYSLVFHRRAEAIAFISGSEKYKEIHGRVLFYEVNGDVIIKAELEGLPQGNKPCNNPIFAFHIHSGGACTGNSNDAFADAGTHYNPDNCPHPYHAGDLPPLFGVNRNAFSAFLTNRFNIREIIGKTIIIHALPDDFTTQPSGNAGEKIACGVITPTAR